MLPNLDRPLVIATILLNIATIIVLAIEVHNRNSSKVVAGLILQIFSLVCVGNTTMVNPVPRKRGERQQNANGNQT
ncbi:hypothetical protein V866_003543 [Kwoniella sp. B9012]